MPPNMAACRISTYTIGALKIWVCGTHHRTFTTGGTECPTRAWARELAVALAQKQHGPQYTEP